MQTNRTGVNEARQVKARKGIAGRLLPQDRPAPAHRGCCQRR